MRDTTFIDSTLNGSNGSSAHAALLHAYPRLLEQYQPESSVYFASPQRALLAMPPFASLLVAGMQDLSQQASESLKLARDLGFERPIVVGAIPFDTNEKPLLRVSIQSEWEEAPARPVLTAAKAVDAESISAYPAPEQYMTGVKDALTRFARGELDKVVLSRTLEVACKQRPDVKGLLNNLAAKNHHGYTFAVDFPAEDGQSKPATLIGASPELLLSRRGNKIIANPLAGSEPRSSDPQEDHRRAQQLLASQKDRYEHAIVIEAVAEALRPFCRDLDIPEQPELIQTETMWHLSTVIEGELKSADTSSLELALAMHPTPAVCGFPKAEAQQAIKDIEPHQRGLFTGMVGWCDSAGDGEWVVTIRCAQIQDCAIRLYAGAGVVAGSCPEKELAETGAKFNTMLQAMGVCI
jgi:isochorismate synthase